MRNDLVSLKDKLIHFVFALSVFGWPGSLPANCFWIVMPIFYNLAPIPIQLHLLAHGALHESFFCHSRSLIPLPGNGGVRPEGP